MIAARLSTLEVAWYWDLVPAGADLAERAGWIRHLAALIDSWAGARIAEVAPAERDRLGPAVAEGLLDRAAGLPANARLIWGAAFVGDELRWMPLLAVAEFRRAKADDPAYLMDHIGVRGKDEDIREPVVDYVSTERGDGIRVFAMAESAQEGIYGRVDAALRLDLPEHAVDVILAARVFGVEQMAAIGGGVEVLMEMLADRSAADLRFDTGVTS